MINHEAAVRVATEALVAALLAAVRAEAATGDTAPDRLLSVDDAADLLGVVRSTAYQEMQAGRLRSVKVGRRRLVSAGAVQDYIRAAGSQPPAAPAPPGAGPGRVALRAGTGAGR